MGNRKLSEKGYWDNILSAARLPLKVKKTQYSPWLINSFFSDQVKAGNYSTLLEAGAGSSAWLPFLAEEYGLTVSGLDYSEPGCVICEENLKIQNIGYDEVLCTDIFKWQGDKKYDIIISLGLVEHFENPAGILEIAREHLNRGGLIITVIPNLMGLSGWLTRIFLPDVYDIHMKLTREDLLEMHEKTGFRCIRTDYTGFFYPMIIPWSVKETGFLFRPGTRLRKITMKILELTNAVITKLLIGLKVKMSSRLFSPVIICIAKND